MNSLSIVIPCKDDIRLASCLASIDDPDAEVVIVLNGDADPVEALLREYQKAHSSTSVVRMAEANLAAALQLGSTTARGTCLLYMDSDCRFEPGTIGKFRSGLKYHEVVKGRIIFESESLLSGVTARSREHHTAEQLTAYKPPLAVHCNIKHRIAGYFFDHRLIWRED